MNALQNWLLKHCSSFFILSFSLFLLFIFNFVHNIERTIFVNEIFSLAGIIIFAVNINLRRGFSKEPIQICMYFLIGYTFVRAIFSLNDIVNYYGYLRTLVLWYSMFSFFLGLAFFQLLHKKFLSINFIDKSAVPLSLLAAIFGNTIATPAALPLLFKNYKYFIGTLILFLLIIFATKKENTTLATLFVFIILTAILKNKKLKQIFFNSAFLIFLVASFFILLTFTDAHWNKFYALGYSTIPIPSANTTWRLMFWSYAFFHNFLLHPLFGIGFGTPIYQANTPITEFVTATNQLHNFNFIYTIGTHNFLIYVLSRLGIFGFMPLLCIYLIVMETVRQLKLSQLTMALFFSFIFMTIGGLCNVMLLTPLYASSYWIILGMLCGSIEFDKAQLMSK